MPPTDSIPDRWDPDVARNLDPVELLVYRSNLLGSDLRITNFAGGNTSAKVTETDPLDGQSVEVLWVKGSGGDLGSAQRDGSRARNHARGVVQKDEEAERGIATGHLAQPADPAFTGLAWLHAVDRQRARPRRRHRSGRRGNRIRSSRYDIRGVCTI